MFVEKAPSIARSMALQCSKGKEDPAVGRLRSQLNEAHADIKTLTTRIEELEASKVRCVYIIVIKFL